MNERPSHLDPTRSFQGLILTLHDYWARHGCVILQPYDMEVGAGTFHPATTLRALGPRRWNVAYVQPSRRPKDGRYGENPNETRLQNLRLTCIDMTTRQQCPVSPFPPR